MKITDETICLLPEEAAELFTYYADQWLGRQYADELLVARVDAIIYHGHADQLPDMIWADDVDWPTNNNDADGPQEYRAQSEQLTTIEQTITKELGSSALDGLGTVLQVDYLKHFVQLPDSTDMREIIEYAANILNDQAHDIGRIAVPADLPPGIAWIFQNVTPDTDGEVYTAERSDRLKAVAQTLMAGLRD